MKKQALLLALASVLQAASAVAVTADAIMHLEKLLDGTEFETDPGLGECPVWPPLAAAQR